MAFKKLPEYPDRLLELANLISNSGLSTKHPDLAILVLEIKRSIRPGKKIEKNGINNIKKYCEALPKNLKELIGNFAEIVLDETSEKTGEPENLSVNTENFALKINSINKIDGKILNVLEKKALDAQKSIMGKACRGNDFLGWIDLPYEDTSEIKSTSKSVREKSDATVFIGIGGSYLGAKAIISALLPENYNMVAKDLKIPEIYFAGHNLSSKYLSDLLNVLKEKRVTLIPISKSGTTTEPAVAFRILKNELEKMGNKPDIVAITDGKKGALKQMADENGWKTFVIPNDVGGRFSVFSPVGLLPVSTAGINIDELLSGARSMAEIIKKSPDPSSNPAMAYAIYRQALHLSGKDIEILSCWSPFLTQITEWWKQLFGESEGKDGKGIFVASTTFTTDLHSVGQLIQDGKRNFFETFLTVEKEEDWPVINEDSKNLDNLNYLAGKNPDYINGKACEGTKSAHEFGRIPTMSIYLKKLNPGALGSLLYFWEYSCAISALIQGVNPFDQPGVEEYKKRMFKLLGRP